MIIFYHFLRPLLDGSGLTLAGELEKEINIKLVIMINTVAGVKAHNLTVE